MTQETKLETNLEIDAEPIRQIFEAQLRRAQLGVRVAVLIMGLSCLALLVMHPQIEGWESQRNINLSVLLGLIAVMLGADRLNLAPIRAAVRAADKSLRFEMTDKGVQIPFFMVTNPAVKRLTRKKETYLRVEWDQIARWCVYPRVGKARPQYLIEMKDQKAEFGHRFGVLRELLGDQEKEVVKLCKRYLGERVEVRDTVF
jgi:hypothetical protein